MSEKQKQPDMSGVLFRNKRKRDEKDPGCQGSITIGGVEWWLSAWVNTAKASGEKYFGLRVKRKSDEQAARAPAPAAAKPEDDDEPVPF